MDASFWLGLVGTVLSSAALGWNIYRDVMDRGSLRVRCYMGDIHSAGVPPRGPILFWSVTNDGRRPIVVQHIGGTIKDTKKEFLIPLPVGDRLPRPLSPYEYASFGTDDFRGLPPNDRIGALWAMDTLGKRYGASRKDVEKVRREMPRERASGFAH